MRFLTRVVTVAALGLGLLGCTAAQFQADLTKVNLFATKYGPIVGKDIIMVANILVQAECSPALVPSTQVASNVLTIVAPNSSSANKVKSALQTNADIAAQLCPLVSAIKAQVGPVPSTAVPSQVVTLPTPTPTGS